MKFIACKFIYFISYLKMFCKKRLLLKKKKQQEPCAKMRKL